MTVNNHSQCVCRHICYQLSRSLSTTWIRHIWLTTQVAWRKGRNPYVAKGGGGVIYPQTDFLPYVASNPLRIMKKAFVTFPVYALAKKCWRKISDIFTSVSNMAAGKWAHNWKKTENPMLRCYLVSRAHKTKFQLLCCQGWVMAIIFTSLDVAVTPEINMADKKV